jgi:tetratricopeptide (TPR) repeat protein
MTVRDRNARSDVDSAGRSARLFLASIVIGLASIAEAYSAEPGPAAAQLASTIAEETAKLNLPPRTTELTSEQAIRVRQAISQGDFTVARHITADVLANSQLQNWRYYPFADFVKNISDVGNPAFETRLNEWVGQNSGDAIPVLIRAQYYRDLGWFKRGENSSQITQPSHMVVFAQYMNKALTDVDTAISLDDGNPYGYYLKLRILHGFGSTQKLKIAFEQAITKYPTYYLLYDVVLATLEPRWGGSVAAMYSFVDQYAGNAPDYSPLKLLYVSLYRDLLASASVACRQYWYEKDKLAACIASNMGKTINADLQKQTLTALHLYDHSSRHQYNVAIKSILFDMLASGGDAYSGAVLQLAATAMQSNTQLKEEDPGHNNYVIDEAVAESWYVKGFYDNALTKDQEALAEIKDTSFPDEEERDVATAEIYRHIAKIYSNLRRYADVIVYENAALALGNVTEDEHFICFSYYLLKDFYDAVSACNQAINDRPENLSAYYWRGEAYRQLGNTDAALKDLTVVADSENNFKTSAVIDISMIYFDKKDIEAALNVLNKYTYVFDINTQSRNDLAVNYNNRCYAYMQLGELKKALDDCTVSLKYGSLPDALRKQQELLKRLGTHETSL